MFCLQPHKSRIRCRCLLRDFPALFCIIVLSIVKIYCSVYNPLGSEDVVVSGPTQVLVIDDYMKPYDTDSLTHTQVQTLGETNRYLMFNISEMKFAENEFINKVGEIHEILICYAGCILFLRLLATFL